MIKTRGRNGMMSVTFTLASAIEASQAAICGEWNDWSDDRDVMEPTEVGFTRTVELQAGRCYRFRYLLDGHRWENDWAADAYVPNDHGSDDSLVDLTSPADAAPAAVEDRAEIPATETAAKEAASAKAAASKTKTASPKKATPAKNVALAEAASDPAAQPHRAVESSQAAKKKAPPRKTTKKSAQ